MSAEHDVMTYARYRLTRVLARSLDQTEPAASAMADQLMQDDEFVSLLLDEMSPCAVRSIRREAIRADFTGRNHDEVMRKHKISRRTLYRCIESNG